MLLLEGGEMNFPVMWGDWLDEKSYNGFKTATKQPSLSIFMTFVKNLIVAKNGSYALRRYFFKGSNSTVEDIRLCWVFRRLRHRHSETPATCKQRGDAARVMFIPPPWIVVAFLPHRLALVSTAVLPLCDQTAAARRGTLGASSSPLFDSV